MHTTQRAGKPYWRVSRTTLAAFITVFMGTLAALAQVSDLSTLRGTVTDRRAHSCRSQKITVIDRYKHRYKTSATTDNHGDYEMPGLKSGNYRLTAKKAGFSTLVEGDIYLMSNQEKRVDARLTVGASTAQITVSGAAEVIQTEGGSISGETTAAQYKNMRFPATHTRTPERCWRRCQTWGIRKAIPA